MGQELVLNQDTKDERMGHDYGLTSLEKAANNIGAYFERKHCGLYWRTGPLPSVKNDRQFL